MKEKVVIVTGSSRGIGLAIAKRLAKEGARVVINSRSQERINEISSELQREGLNVIGVGADIQTKEGAEKLIEKATEKWGGVDILVNNAGINRDNLFLRMKEDEWEEVIKTNLNGMFHCTKASIRGMTKKRWGRIINISSIVGITGNPGQANYSAAKAGIIGFTKTLAQEFGGRNITANVIAPGFIETEMTDKLPEKIKEQMLGRIPLGKFGTCDDVAAMVRFLASEEAGYITGQVLVVDGGLAL